MLKALAGVGLLLVGCGSVVLEPAQDAAPSADAAPEAARDAGPPPNPACLETDQSIATCIAAGAAGSWTAPGTCLVNFAPGKPQKRTPDGISERESPFCCGFVKVGEVTALCCADLSICDGG